MERPRHGWLRSRADDRQAPAPVERPPSPAFRSDNDLYQWWLWGRIALPITVLCFGVLRNFGLPLDYAPLAALPAFLLDAVMRYTAWRDRKAGKRFNQYDADDVFW